VGEGPLSLGFDFGTSGVRIAIITREKGRVFDAARAWERPDAVSDAGEWGRLMDDLLESIPEPVRAEIGAITIRQVITFKLMMKLMTRPP
jgi:sugar (pentulose or hexulose) kinase